MLVNSRDKKTIQDYIDSLKRQFSNVEALTVELHNELVALVINNSSACATVYLQGAQLASYQPHGETPVIWLSKHCDFRAGRPLRGGIPVCWPWFGDLPKNPKGLQNQLLALDSIPAHGFVRDKDWQLESVDNTDDDKTVVTLSLKVISDSCSGWKFPCTLTLKIGIGRELTLALSVKNNGDKTFIACGALHSYFCVHDIQKTSIVGLADVDYIDSLQQWKHFIEQGEIIINQETDRIYQSVPQKVILQDHGRSRNIVLIHNNAPSLVVWNPWLEKARRLSHFAQDDYLQMLCLETGRILEHQQTVSSGESDTFSVSIACSKF